MSKLHRNSQKRIYVQNCVYFVTTCTFERYPYFLENIFCELLIEEIKFCKELMGFNLIGYKINPEHIHLMFAPGKKYNVSKIMQFIKRNFSQNINKIIKSNYVSNKRRQCALSPFKCFDKKIENLKCKYNDQINNRKPFKWPVYALRSFDGQAKTTL
jgi:REP element-mobilizing transposase RayT